MVPSRGGDLGIIGTLWIIPMVSLKKLWGEKKARLVSGKQVFK